jgi:hypothetical protein
MDRIGAQPKEYVSGGQNPTRNTRSRSNDHIPEALEERHCKTLVGTSKLIPYRTPRMKPYYHCLGPLLHDTGYMHQRIKHRGVTVNWRRLYNITEHHNASLVARQYLQHTRDDQTSNPFPKTQYSNNTHTHTHTHTHKVILLKQNQNRSRYNVWEPEGLVTRSPPTFYSFSIDGGKGN